MTEKRIAVISTIAAIIITTLIWHDREALAIYLCLTAGLAYVIYKAIIEIKNGKD
jgi:hypothetical protein